MENESTFVAPEGVYSLTEEHKPSLAQSTTAPILFLTKVSSVVIRVPPAKTQGGGPPGLAQLLGGNKDAKKDKERDKNVTGLKEDGYSLSSSDTPDENDQLPSIQENGNPASPSLPEQQTIFSSGGGGRKKHGARPKHNMRTTSSTFVTRIQTGEGWSKTLQSKQGDLTLLCYNVAKSFLMVEAGSKAKVHFTLLHIYVTQRSYRNLLQESSLQHTRHATISTSRQLPLNTSTSLLASTLAILFG